MLPSHKKIDFHFFPFLLLSAEILDHSSATFTISHPAACVKSFEKTKVRIILEGLKGKPIAEIGGEYQISQP